MRLGINIKNNSRKIAKLLSIDDVKDTDLHKFLLEVKEKCEKSISFNAKKITS